MAVIESIPEKNQTPSAQKGVLDYCMQPSKTLDEDEQLAYISGYNCVPELANESFLATQKVYGHEPDGVRFYHFVQSFKIGEAISPQEANDIGMELVQSFEKFKNHEAIVATHIDKDHLHNHIVVCAYDLESGRKIHYNKYFLGDLRQRSDEICQAHGLNVLKKYNPNVKSQRLGPKEYRAAMNGNSWKMALRATIDYCMTRAMNQNEFQAEMKKFGYEMTWMANRRNITYICRTDDGKERRVRDIKLNDEKYLKENMEHEFRIRTKLYGQAEDEKYPFGTSGGDGRNNAGNRGGSGDSDGSDQRRGLEPSVQSDTTTARSVNGFDGTESQFEGFGRELRRLDDESGTGTDGSFGESDTKNSERSDRTGWECERERFKNHKKKHLSGRSNLVSAPRAHVSPDNLDLSLMAVRGIANVTSILDGEDESEEEKQRRQATNTGAAIGALAGLAVGAAIGFMQSESDSDEDVAEEESEAFDMTM